MNANINGQDLFLELRDKTNALNTALGEFGRRGRAYAQAEHDYKVEMAKKILIEREKGVPVTIISDICRGDREIARKRFDRDVAETMYEAAKEAIQAYKLQIRLLDAQIDREWGSAK